MICGLTSFTNDSKSRTLFSSRVLVAHAFDGSLKSGAKLGPMQLCQFVHFETLISLFCLFLCFVVVVWECGQFYWLEPLELFTVSSFLCC